MSHIAAFVRTLRHSGIPVYPGSTIELCRGLEHIDLSKAEDFHAASRTSLVYRHQDLKKFDTLFRAFWRNKDLFILEPESENILIPESQSQAASNRPDEDGDDAESALFTYSDRERLSTKDLGQLSDAEIVQAQRLMRQFIAAFASRKSHRLRPRGRGRRLDFRRMLRQTSTQGTGLMTLRFRRPKIRKLRLMLMCDVSGSMSHYTHFLLRFIYALRRELPVTDAAVFATRLTPIADLLSIDVDESLLKIAERVQDWGGGTDIGGCLRQFNNHYAHHLIRSDTVVVILSDGWDCGDDYTMRDEIARLRRRAHKIIWLNPLMGNPEYQPLTQGMRTALPYLDYFLPAHNLESLARLARTLSKVWH